MKSNTPNTTEQIKSYCVLTKLACLLARQAARESFISHASSRVEPSAEIVPTPYSNPDSKESNHDK